MKLEQPHALVTLSASFNADIVFAVTPRAALAEPSEGQLVKPGFSNTGDIILEFMCLSQRRRRFLDPAEVARVEGLLGFAVLMVLVGSSLTRTGRPSATVRK